MIYKSTISSVSPNMNYLNYSYYVTVLYYIYIMVCTCLYMAALFSALGTLNLIMVDNVHVLYIHVLLTLELTEHLRSYS